MRFGQDLSAPIGQQWYQVIEKQKKSVGMSRRRKYDLERVFGVNFVNHVALKGFHTGPVSVRKVDAIVKLLLSTSILPNKGRPNMVQSIPDVNPHDVKILTRVTNVKTTQVLRLRFSLRRRSTCANTDNT